MPGILAGCLQDIQIQATLSLPFGGRKTNMTVPADCHRVEGVRHRQAKAHKADFDNMTGDYRMKELIQSSSISLQ